MLYELCQCYNRCYNDKKIWVWLRAEVPNIWTALSCLALLWGWEGNLSHFFLDRTVKRGVVLKDRKCHKSILMKSGSCCVVLCAWCENRERCAEIISCTPILWDAKDTALAATELMEQSMFWKGKWMHHVSQTSLSLGNQKRDKHNVYPYCSPIQDYFSLTTRQ